MTDWIYEISRNKLTHSMEVLTQIYSRYWSTLKSKVLKLGFLALRCWYNGILLMEILAAPEPEVRETVLMVLLLGFIEFSWDNLLSDVERFAASTGLKG